MPDAHTQTETAPCAHTQTETEPAPKDPAVAKSVGYFKDSFAKSVQSCLENDTEIKPVLLAALRAARNMPPSEWETAKRILDSALRAAYCCAISQLQNALLTTMQMHDVFQLCKGPAAEERFYHYMAHSHRLKTLYPHYSEARFSAHARHVCENVAGAFERGSQGKQMVDPGVLWAMFTAGKEVPRRSTKEAKQVMVLEQLRYIYTSGACAEDAAAAHWVAPNEDIAQLVDDAIVTFGRALNFALTMECHEDMYAVLFGAYYLGTEVLAKKSELDALDALDALEEKGVRLRAHIATARQRMDSAFTPAQKDALFAMEQYKTMKAEWVRERSVWERGVSSKHIKKAERVHSRRGAELLGVREVQWRMCGKAPVAAPAGAAGAAAPAGGESPPIILGEAYAGAHANDTHRMVATGSAQIGAHAQNGFVQWKVDAHDGAAAAAAAAAAGPAKPQKSESPPPHDRDGEATGNVLDTAAETLALLRDCDFELSGVQIAAAPKPQKSKSTQRRKRAAEKPTAKAKKQRKVQQEQEQKQEQEQEQEQAQAQEQAQEQAEHEKDAMEIVERPEKKGFVQRSLVAEANSYRLPDGCEKRDGWQIAAEHGYVYLMNVKTGHRELFDTYYNDAGGGCRPMSPVLPQTTPQWVCK